MELILTGDSVPAVELQRLGLVNKVFPKDQVEEEAIKLARRVAALSATVVASAKQAVLTGENVDPDADGCRRLLTNPLINQPRIHTLKPAWYMRRRCTTRRSALMIARRGCLHFWRSAPRGLNTGRTRVGIPLPGTWDDRVQKIAFVRGRRSFLGWQRSENSKPFPDLHYFPRMQHANSTCNPWHSSQISAQLHLNLEFCLQSRQARDHVSWEITNLVVNPYYSGGLWADKVRGITRQLGS